MKSAKLLNIVHWSGEVYAETPHPELVAEYTVDESDMPAIWAFKIFEGIGAVATQASDDDMMKYRSLASVLGAGRVTTTMQTVFWFKRRELAVLYAALCNLQTQYLDKSRIDMEKSLMRASWSEPDEERQASWYQTSIKSQASYVVAATANLMLMLQGALGSGEAIRLSVS